MNSCAENESTSSINEHNFSNLQGEPHDYKTYDNVAKDLVISCFKESYMEVVEDPGTVEIDVGNNNDKTDIASPEEDRNEIITAAECHPSNFHSEDPNYHILSSDQLAQNNFHPEGSTEVVVSEYETPVEVLTDLVISCKEESYIEVVEDQATVEIDLGNNNDKINSASPMEDQNKNITAANCDRSHSRSEDPNYHILAPVQFAQNNFYPEDQNKILSAVISNNSSFHSKNPNHIVKGLKFEPISFNSSVPDQMSTAVKTERSNFHTEISNQVLATNKFDQNRSPSEEFPNEAMVCHLRAPTTPDNTEPMPRPISVKKLRKGLCLTTNCGDTTTRLYNAGIDLTDDNKRLKACPACHLRFVSLRPLVVHMQQLHLEGVCFFIVIVI